MYVPWSEIMRWKPQWQFHVTPPQNPVGMSQHLLYYVCLWFGSPHLTDGWGDGEGSEHWQETLEPADSSETGCETGTSTHWADSNSSLQVITGNTEPGCDLSDHLNTPANLGEQESYSAPLHIPRPFCLPPACSLLHRCAETPRQQLPLHLGMKRERERESLSTLSSLGGILLAVAIKTLLVTPLVRLVPNPQQF